MNVCCSLLEQYVVVAGDLDKPMSIAVDPLAGLLFWTDRGRSPKIESARLDGSERRILVNESINFVTGISLDFQENKVYWCDSRLDTIERIDYGGQNRVLLLDNMHVHSPYGLAIYQAKIYWIDTTLHGGSIFEAPKNNVSSFNVILTELGESLKDIKVRLGDTIA